MEARRAASVNPDESALALAARLHHLPGDPEAPSLRADLASLRGRATWTTNRLIDRWSAQGGPVANPALACVIFGIEGFAYDQTLEVN